VVQKVQGKFLDENQIKTMNHFLPSNGNFQEKEIKALYSIFYEETQEVQFIFHKELPLDEPYTYHKKLFEVSFPYSVIY